MNRHHWLISFVLLVVAFPAFAADKGKVPEGTWRLAAYQGGSTEYTLAILKTESGDAGKPKVTVEASAPFLQGGLKVKSANLEGKLLKITFESSGSDWTLEAVVGKREDKGLAGSLDIGRGILPSLLLPTDLKEIAPKDAAKPVDIPQMKEIGQLTSKPLGLRIQARREKDADKKAELKKKALAAAEEAAEKLPKLYQEVLDKNPDSPVVMDVVVNQLKIAGRKKTEVDQLKKWVELGEKAAEGYGPALTQDTRIEIGTMLSGVEGADKYALQYCLKLEKILNDKSSAALQARILKLIALALTKAGKTEEAKAMADRVEKIEEILDKEAAAKNPPLKAEKFEGRTGKSKRVAVMELFTGAQCPPCVAADVGFDALAKTYQPRDVVLLQYHMHIPGPDPLANTETVARMDYYIKAFPDDVGGTPSTIFNGKAEAGGGGPVSVAKGKYDEYRKLLDALLETDDVVQLTASATRRGDRIDIQAEVKGLKDADENKKLRFVLIEEAIRYQGGNGLRFHHHVVRNFPGGVEGFALKEMNSKQNASVDLKELRKNLATYLENFNQEQAFPYIDRPLALKHLKLVALVQDDKTAEILQAIQLDIPEEGSEK